MSDIDWENKYWEKYDLVEIHLKNSQELSSENYKLKQTISDKDKTLKQCFDAMEDDEKDVEDLHKEIEAKDKEIADFAIVCNAKLEEKEKEIYRYREWIVIVANEMNSKTTKSQFQLVTELLKLIIPPPTETPNADKE